MAVLVPLVKSGQVATVSVAVVFGSIATGATGLRFLAARLSHRRLDASDWWILVAWTFTMGLMMMCILGMGFMSLRKAVEEKVVRHVLTETSTEAVLGGFGWHYEEIVLKFGLGPITQYHKVRCRPATLVLLRSGKF